MIKKDAEASFFAECIEETAFSIYPMKKVEKGNEGK